MDSLLQIVLDLQARVNALLITPRVRLYSFAYKKLGTDASPHDNAPDPLACAETVDMLYYGTFGRFIGERLDISTIGLNASMARNPSRFQRIYFPESPKPGDIVVAVTRINSGVTTHGHITIMSLYDKMMSNDTPSNKGLFLENWTLTKFRQYYAGALGLEINIYRPL